MNVRKAGLVGVGALATMFAASPMASAVELPEQPPTSATASDPCSFSAQGDDASEVSNVSDDNPANVIWQSPFGGDNAGNAGKCSTYGNDNDKGNGEGNLFTVNGQQVPFPSASNGFGGGVVQ